MLFLTSNKKLLRLVLSSSLERSMNCLMDMQSPLEIRDIIRFLFLIIYLVTLSNHTKNALKYQTSLQNSVIIPVKLYIRYNVTFYCRSQFTQDWNLYTRSFFWSLFSNPVNVVDFHCTLLYVWTLFWKKICLKYFKLMRDSTVHRQ